ncbi:MAG: hypothetical protein IGS38_03720 [Synechococcales cyanobacterium M58_A2018_015]|nr:hypothetical protein [Synechococcales cyanobacterium M58_A2018_015]
MDIPQLLIKAVIALVCAAIADIFVPRRVPGGIAGQILIGLAGIWLGEWGVAILRRDYGINYEFLSWQVQGVLIIPSIIGCTVVLYGVTALIRWGRSISHSFL